MQWNKLYSKLAAQDAYLHHCAHSNTIIRDQKSQMML